MVVGILLTADYFEMIRRDGEDPVSYLRDDVQTMKALQSEIERLGGCIR